MQKSNKYRYTEWEDFINGIYNIPENEKEEIKLANIIFSDFNLFDSLCKKVISEWPLICDENLNNKNINRVAWLGQAALNIEHNIKERITKNVWKTIPYNFQNILNEIALENIKIYEKKSKKIHTEMEINLFGGNT